MQILAKTCSIIAHQKKEMTHLCTLRQCNINQKFLCQDCVDENVHRHDQNNNDHLLNEDQFKTKLKTELDNMPDPQSYKNQQNYLSINKRKLKNLANLMFNNLKEIQQELGIQDYSDYKYELIRKAHEKLQTCHFSKLDFLCKQFLTIDQDYKLKFTSTFQKIQNLFKALNQYYIESDQIIGEILNQELNFSLKSTINEIQSDQFYENCVLIKQSEEPFLQDDSGIKSVIKTCLSTCPERLNQYIFGYYLRNIIQGNYSLVSLLSHKLQIIQNQSPYIEESMIIFETIITYLQQTLMDGVKVIKNKMIFNQKKVQYLWLLRSILFAKIKIQFQSLQMIKKYSKIRSLQYGNIQQTVLIIKM